MFTVLRAFAPSIRPYWWLFLLLMLFLFLLLMLFLFLGVSANATKPFLIREFVTLFEAASFDMEAAERILMLFLILLAVGWGFWRTFDCCVTVFESWVMRDLEKSTFALVQAQSMRFFEKVFTGSLVKQATRFRDSFETITDVFVFQIFRDLLMVSVAFAVFFRERPELAWMLLGWFAVFVGMNVLFAFLKFPLDQKLTAASSAVSGELADTMSNIATVKAYAHEKLTQKEFDAKSDESNRRRLRSWMMTNLFMSMQAVLMSGFEYLFIRDMIRQRAEGTFSAGDFAFFQSNLAMMLMFLWMFGHNMRILFQDVADAREMAEIRAQIPEVRDAADAAELTVTNGEVCFEDVEFGYDGNGRRELTEFGLTIKPGQTVAFVGPSGAGKTTLMKVLMRYYDLRSGGILIDGQNIARVTQHSLRSNVALVPQQAELFNKTVLENILFARPGATLEDVIEAAKRARIWDRIQKLPEGLNTVVGEDGVKLSGGEKQRIALARAFLADRKLLILDEATSALDSITETEIQAAIAELLRDRTSLVIAHRLSTIMKADVIVVMDGGRIVETGTHDELLAKGGLYATLWDHQSGGYIAE
jgi:ATP-binding cassette, subfamily B, bacterial